MINFSAAIRREGYEEGHAEGLSQGLSQGLVQGRKENLIENIRSFQAYGMDLEEILKVLKVDRETAEEIRRQLN